jgi:EAL domain-containing protein (putative c-di-GMP-specific phosphodiesterase class I)
MHQVDHGLRFPENLESTKSKLDFRIKTCIQGRAFINLLEIQGNKLFLSFNLSIAKYKRESLISWVVENLQWFNIHK